jgi:hypothetical protein
MTNYLAMNSDGMTPMVLAVLKALRQHAEVQWVTPAVAGGPLAGVPRDGFLLVVGTRKLALPLATSEDEAVRQALELV